MRQELLELHNTNQGIEAIEAMIKYEEVNKNKSLRDSAYSLSPRFHRFMKDSRQGLMSDESKRLTRNRLYKSLLDTINTYFPAPKKEIFAGYGKPGRKLTLDILAEEKNLKSIEKMKDAINLPLDRFKEIISNSEGSLNKKSRDLEARFIQYNKDAGTHGYDTDMRIYNNLYDRLDVLTLEYLNSKNETDMVKLLPFDNLIDFVNDNELSSTINKEGKKMFDKFNEFVWKKNTNPNFDTKGDNQTNLTKQLFDWIEESQDKTPKSISREDIKNLVLKGDLKGACELIGAKTLDEKWKKRAEQADNENTRGEVFVSIENYIKTL